MPISYNAKFGLRQQFLQKQLTTVAFDSSGLTPKQKSNVKKWATRYRRNWDLFVDEVLGITLYPIQKMKIHMMGVSDTYYDISTRGSAKSFLVGVGAMCKFCLYPYSSIVITSSTIAQASKLVERKIRDEIIKKLSPYLLYLYSKEYILIYKSQTEGGYIVENKLNGSKIIVLPCLESSRGERATDLILEEVRLLRKGIVDSVFIPMGYSRPAKYLLKKEYQNKRWQEQFRTISITSARYQYEWFYREFKKTVVGYYNSKYEKFVPLAEDIFAAIAEGSRTWADYRKAKAAMSSMDFSMEVLNQMLGENERSFFNYKEFNENQTLSQAFVPPKLDDIYLQRDLGNPQPEDTEIRLVGIDYAFANTTSTKKNDATQIICMSLHWKNHHFERHVDYIEGHEASDSIGANNRCRELVWDYASKAPEFYVAPDTRSGGETLFNRMTMPWEHPQRGGYWDKRGFTVTNNLSLHVVTSAKLDDFRSRTVDHDAIPCIIPIIGSTQLNSACWSGLKKNLECNNIKFLCSSDKKQELLEDSGEFYRMTSEELADALYPHLMTENLIQEAVGLNTSITQNNEIKLTESGQNTKDLIVLLSYLSYVADRLENERNKTLSDEDYEEDLLNIKLVY